MGLAGLEPARLSTLAPKTSAASISPETRLLEVVNPPAVLPLYLGGVFICCANIIFKKPATYAP